MELAFTILICCGAYAVACVARAFWHIGTERYFDNRRWERQAEIDRVEREIVLALINCAASNPKAAEILLARERARLVPPSSPYYTAYRKLFDFDLGGEPVPTTELANTREEPCDSAVQS